VTGQNCNDAMHGGNRAESIASRTYRLSSLSASRNTARDRGDWPTLDSWPQKLLFTAMIAGSIGTLILSLLPAPVAISHFVTDDMFYYLTAARNVVNGQIASLDGHSPTNGFHPLWMIICILITATFRDPTTAYHVTLLLCAALFIATGWMLYRVVRRVGGETLALAVGALFLCNYRMITIPLGGLETSLYGFSVVLLLGWLVARADDGPRSIRDAVALGLLLAFTYWSRMDALLLGVFVCLGIVLFTAGNSFAKRVGLSLVSGVVSLLATAPWFAFSVHSVGVLLPRSGTAIQSWSAHVTNPSLSLIANLAALARAKIGGLVEPLNDIANTIGVFPFTPSPTSPLRYFGALVTVVVLFALAIFLIRLRHAPSLRPYSWIPLYSIAHIGYYIAFAKPEIRYMYPVFILMSFYIAVGLRWLINRTSQPTRTESIIGVMALIMVCSTFIAGTSAFQRGYGVGRFHSLQLGLYERVAPWIKSHTEPNAVVGGFNSGIVSYYSDRRVVNLDGVMNDAAISAIQKHKLSEYIDSQRIEYLADIDGELIRFMDSFSGDKDWRTKWQEAYSASIPTFGGTSDTRFLVLRRISAEPAS
jgi:hypothetical protein